MVAVLAILAGKFVLSVRVIEEDEFLVTHGEKPPTIFVPDTVHLGDLEIEGGRTMTIEDKNYFQQGNVYIGEGSKLVIRDSQFMQGGGNVPTVHVNVFVEGELEIDNSLVFPDPNTDALVTVSARRGGKVNITNSPTSIHALFVSRGAEVTLVNSEMIYKIGGLLQVGGGDIRLVNSTIGAIGLTVPGGAHLNITGLESGACFESWDVHEMIPEAGYDVMLENSCILDDDFDDEYKHGPFERGWQFYLDADSHVRISDSELRKVFINDLAGVEAEFENLRVGNPSSLKYRDIEIRNVTLMGQWPFTLRDSNVTITNSDYLFLQPLGQSIITLVGSHVVEFIPRNFFGTVIFENSSWTEAGEIIGGEEYHSMENNFTIKGSLKIDGVRENLRWKDARVTREYEVLVKDDDGNPVGGVLIEIKGQEFVSDERGQIKFNLMLDESNYDEPEKLNVVEGGRAVAQKEVDFFTSTPIVYYNEKKIF